MAVEETQGQRERGGRRAGQAAGLVVVLAVAAVVRLVGITWGLPDATHLFSYHPDEYHSLRGAFSLALGDLNPHFFNYGSLYLYLVGAAAAVADPALFASVAEAVPGGPVLPEVLRQWTLYARIVTLILSLGTVAVVYAIARRIWGHREGLAAGLLLALAPLHVLHSHYGTVDVPGAFFAVLALYFAVAMLDELSWRHVLWAGGAAGLAASVKYSGGVALVAPLVAWAIVRMRAAKNGRQADWRMVVALPVTAFAAFALTSPYTLIDWSSAWRDISFEMEHMRTGDDPAMMALYPNGWLFHLRNLALGTGMIMPAAALLGLAGGLVARRNGLWLLLALALVTFAMIGGPQVRYARYAIPLLPLIAILAGGIVSDDLPAIARGRFRAWGMAAAIALVMAGSVLGAGMMTHQLLRDLVDTDAQAETLALIEEQVPQDGTIGLITEPWFYHPPVDYCNGGVALRANPLWAPYRDPIRELAILGLDAEALREQRPDVVVLTGFEIAVQRTASAPRAVEFMRALDELGYTPLNRPRGFAWNWASRRPLAQDWLYPYPWIEIRARG